MSGGETDGAAGRPAQKEVIDDSDILNAMAEGEEESEAEVEEGAPVGEGQGESGGDGKR